MLTPYLLGILSGAFGSIAALLPVCTRRNGPTKLECQICRRTVVEGLVDALKQLDEAKRELETHRTNILTTTTQEKSDE